MPFFALIKVSEIITMIYSESMFGHILNWPLRIEHSELERSTIFIYWENYGKVTISMAIFNSYAKLPEGSYGL